MFFAIEIATVPGFGFQGGPGFSTNIQNIVGGHESRNADWDICRHKYTAPFKNISDVQYANIKAVFMICRGRNHTFLHKDAGDYKANNEMFAVADGVSKVFQLTKVSSVAGTTSTYVRMVQRPVAGAEVFEDGSASTATVSTRDGTVSFATVPARGIVLTWSGEFRVQVRFDNDYLPFSIDDKRPDGFAHNGSIDLYEVLDEDEDAS